MPVGFPTKVNYATGDVLSATNMNDLSGTVNLLQSAQFAAGKNKIINGDFYLWQRGTTFTNAAFNAYTSDRWAIYYNGTMTQTVSQQTFTPGTAPVAGYEGSFFWRWNVTAASGNTGENIFQKIEDVRTLAGQTATVSFWAKADAARTVGVYAIQNFGSGGSGAVSVNFGNASLTTAWQRFTLTAAIPSVSGKTIGTGSNLEIDLYIPNNTVLTFDLWGVQVEASSVALPFQTATGSVGGEIALCQRYYYRTTPNTNPDLGFGIASATTGGFGQIKLAQTMRFPPTSLDFGGTIIFYDGVNIYTASTITLDSSANQTSDIAQVSFTGMTGMTQFRMYHIKGNASNTYIGFSAEL